MGEHAVKLHGMGPRLFVKTVCFERVAIDEIGAVMGFDRALYRRKYIGVGKNVARIHKNNIMAGGAFNALVHCFIGGIVGFGNNFCTAEGCQKFLRAVL